MAPVIISCSKCSEPLPPKHFMTCSSCKIKLHLDTCATVTEKHYNYLSVKSRAEWKCSNCVWKKANGIATPVYPKAEPPHQNSTPTGSHSLQLNLNTTFTSSTARKSLTPSSIPRPIASAPTKHLDQEKSAAVKKKVVTNLSIMSELISLRDNVTKQLNSQNEKIIDIVTMLGDIKNSVLEVNTNCSALRIDVDNICESLDGAKDNRDMLINAIESIQLRFQTLQNDQHSLQDKVSVAGTKVASLQQDVPSDLIRAGSEISTKECTVVDYSTKEALDKRTTPKTKELQYVQVHSAPRVPKKPLAKEAKVDELSEDDGWQVHTNKKHRRSYQPVIRGIMQEDLQIQTVERTKRLHACFFKPNTAPEAVKAHMEQICTNNAYEVTILKLKHNRYASFVLTIPESTFKIFTSPASWPAGTEIREWFPRGAGSAAYSNRPHTSGAE